MNVAACGCFAFAALRQPGDRHALLMGGGWVLGQIARAISRNLLRSVGFDRAMGRLDPPLHGRAQPAVLHAFNAADIAVPLAHPPDHVGGAVGRVIVDDDQFPSVVVEGAGEGLMERLDVPGFVVGRYDDRDGS